RVGWVAAPHAIRQKMNTGKQGADLCSSSMSQVVVEACLKDVDLWRRYLDELRDRYRGRRDAMLESLETAMPAGATWTRPGGGLFLWATLPSQLDTTNLLARALRSNVAFVPGRGAYLDGRGGDSMRLNYSGVDEAAIREGVRRIGAVVTEQLELYGDMVGEPMPTRRASDGASTTQEPVDQQTEGALVRFPSARRRAGER
ncbi:MAG: aminotransferase class I/II-fold pyridoxal phosphate-dependent enzyme, partial [Solirubrobacteraceae bacterium]|nr:aminotransferase class I/II-fold pyridoxal phosphate-dependent enzyme [Solirubrobacteraceae bacterium]